MDKIKKALMITAIIFITLNVYADDWSSSNFNSDFNRKDKYKSKNIDNDGEYDSFNNDIEDKDFIAENEENSWNRNFKSTQSHKGWNKTMKSSFSKRGWSSFNSRDDYDNRTTYNSPDSQDSNYNSDERRGAKQNK